MRGHMINRTLIEARRARRVGMACICKLCVSIIVAMHVPYLYAQQVASDAASTSVTQSNPSAIKSVEDAEAALIKAAEMRAEIEARHAEEKHACLPKFFATSCIDAAKERRRKELMQLRSVEVEAHTLKRHARVEERDRALTDRRAKEEVKRQERLQVHESDATPSAVDRKEEPSTPILRDEPRANVHDRTEKKEARLKAIRAKEASKPEQRAKKVAAYEKKGQVASKRQQQIKDNKAGKEKKRQMKAVRAVAVP